MPNLLISAIYVTADMIFDHRVHIQFALQSIKHTNEINNQKEQKITA